VAQVAITFNGRSYRFACGEADAERLRAICDYVKSKLDSLASEHGSVGDERLVLMAALTIADELFDARADVDSLLDGAADKLKDAIGADDADESVAAQSAAEKRLRTP
jgi:cell division protein ZapA